LKQLAAYGRPPAVTTPTGPLIFATTVAAAADAAPFFIILLNKKIIKNTNRKTRKTNE